MALPTLTPTSQTSAIILTSTGSAALVADACPIGAYTGSLDFLTGAAAQVAYTYKKLGGDVLDIELKPENVYANYEEAVLEYSYILNLHQSKNALGSALGSTTGSFNHQGEALSGPENAQLKYPKFGIDYALRVSDLFSHEAVAGGSDPIYSASFDSVNDQQDYDLQTIISSSAATDSTVPYFELIDNKRVTIRQVYYISPRQMWRFYGYYGGLNVVGDLQSYGQYADDSSFNVIPVWQNKLQAIQYEDHLYTRTSHYSFEVIDNKLRLYPIPTNVSPEKFWVRFSIKSDPWEDSNTDNGNEGVNNMNTLPFENVPYLNINSIGKQWIRRFALALSKETLGQIRGKFGGSIPIPGDSITLNASDLLSQAKDEQSTLREELKTMLAEMTYEKIVETDASIVENTTKITTQVPLKIFVG
jgi:hypothetical protein